MKKIGIVIYNYPLGNQLSLISCATSLAREGYDVHIFIDSLIYERSRADFEEENISVHAIEIEVDPRVAKSALSKRLNAFVNNMAAERRDKKLSRSRSVLLHAGSALYWPVDAVKQSLRYSFHAQALPGPSVNEIETYTKRFFPFLIEFHQKIAGQIDEDYVCVIGVEPFGLIAATLVANASKHATSIPVIYYSQDLLLERECYTFESKTLKPLERMCNQACSFTIIQDKSRAKYLCDDNNLESESIICVPVSGLESAYRMKGGLLHDMCGIPREKKILLNAGSIYEWAMCFETAQAAQTWKDNFVLVLHSGREDMKNNALVNRIRGLSESNKVYLSLKQVDWQKMAELVSSADIGLVFYNYPGPNWYEMGYASNKLVQYLQAGLPVITSDIPSLRDVVDNYQCGECAKDLDDIEYLAEKIFNDYERYRANAFRCYENEFDFSKYFKKVVERIKEIEVSSC